MDEGPPTVASALEALLADCDPVGRTDRVTLSGARGRVVAAAVTARTAVPSSDVAAGDVLFEAGHRLRPADLALLKGAGVDECEVYQRPTVGVVPTGEELVQRDAGPDERVEVAGVALAQYADRWGGTATYRPDVSEARPSLRAAIQRDLTRDAVVITGVQREDVVREVVADLGEIRVPAVAADPGGTVAVASVADRPVLLLPEAPVDCLVGAVQLLRPLLAGLGGASLPGHPVRRARLAEAVESAPGTRTFVPAAVSDGVATPTPSPTLREVTAADGWVTVPEEATELAAAETVAVADWAG